jgi:hypothetical protein
VQIAATPYKTKEIKIAKVSIKRRLEFRSTTAFKSASRSNHQGADSSDKVRWSYSRVADRHVCNRSFGKFSDSLQG